LLPTGFTAWAAAASRWRDKVKASGLSFAGRRKFWQVFTAHAMTNAESSPSESDFDRFVAEVKGLGAAVESGTVTLVGAGPGDPELLTLRAVRALQSADVILFDDLVSRGVLDFARREARKLLVGKTGFGPSCKQEDINALMVSLAKQGKRVVRLKGGDPLIFGRAGEELDACAANGIKAEIVPGISAAQGAAASLGLSLTDRKHSRRLQYITGHAQNGRLPSDIDWRALADPVTTTAIYMPVRTLETLVATALDNGLDPATPAAAIARATRPDQQVVHSAIAELPARLAEAQLPGPVLVMLGATVGGAAAAEPAAARI
jgi:uroporphyrin-III C-methyltransferase/precorrin-2 dehydrogenase/sirohydrochlorin ferrochelatase